MTSKPLCVETGQPPDTTTIMPGKQSEKQHFRALIKMLGKLETGGTSMKIVEEVNFK